MREYLLIRRKDTLGFVDFMRGKYSIYNKEYILNMIKQMTNAEKRRLINEPFSKLWEDLWGIHSTKLQTTNKTRHLTDMNAKIASSRTLDPYKAEENSSRNKFESLKSGVYTKTDCYTLEELIQSTPYIWNEPEWGFPKGRRNYQERDYDCAVREFCEETGYHSENLTVLKNIQPFEEIFTGSNYKSYKHKYYVTFMQYETTLSSRCLQECEVSKSEWMTVDQCISSMRSYNVEKQKVILSVEKMLSENILSLVSF